MEEVKEESGIHGRIVPVEIDQQMKSAYIDYSMSVIVARALPDVRDGMKPVHRRILYAMNEAGITSTVPFKKSARIVGDVLGKYHPHGSLNAIRAGKFALIIPVMTLVDGRCVAIITCIPTARAF